MSLTGLPAPGWHLLPLAEVPPAHPSAWQGRPILLLFWSVGCPGCQHRALPLSLKVAALYPEVQLAGIHTQIDTRRYSVAQIEAVRQLFHLPYPLWRDDGHRTFSTYQAEGTPHWILIDAQGIIQKTIFGSLPDAQSRLDYALRELIGR